MTKESPRTADWEIKFMAEHGIDYALYCWYSSESSEPIRATDYAAAWEYGHFYAKYSDKVKIALLWEAANCTHPKSLDDFKNTLVPYWIDYFFSDERYMRIDNKAVMSCFGENVLANDLGGRENVRKALDYLRSEVKKLGYDDLILMGTHPDGKLLAECGFDASHAYHWGENGYRLEENYAGIERAINSKTVSVVPTISVGFNNVGWGGERRAAYGKTAIWKKDLFTVSKTTCRCIRSHRRFCICSICPRGTNTARGPILCHRDFAASAILTR